MFVFLFLLLLFWFVLFLFVFRHNFKRGIATHRPGSPQDANRHLSALKDWFHTKPVILLTCESWVLVHVTSITEPRCDCNCCRILMAVWVLWEYVDPSHYKESSFSPLTATLGLLLQEPKASICLLQLAVKIQIGWFGMWIKVNYWPLTFLKSFVNKSAWEPVPCGFSTYLHHPIWRTIVCVIQTWSYRWACETH